MTTEDILEYLTEPFKFWACPEHPKGIVDWVEGIPFCKDCFQQGSMAEWSKAARSIARG